MSDDPNEFIAPFVSPLTHDEHARIGRIAVLWGQVDMALDKILDKVLGITPKQRMVLLGDRPIGAKLDLLNQHLDAILEDDIRSMVRQFWDLANQTKTLRNRCFHGVWGFRCKSENNVSAAAAHHKAPGDPLKVTQLPALEKKLCKTARLGVIAMAKLHKFPVLEGGFGRLFHGKGSEPAWLQEWTEQHPLDDANLDHRWKAGRLPFLKKPL